MKNNYRIESAELRKADKELEQITENLDLDKETFRKIFHIQKTIRSAATLLDETDKALNLTERLFDKLKG